MAKPEERVETKVQAWYKAALVDLAAERETSLNDLVAKALVDMTGHTLADVLLPKGRPGRKATVQRDEPEPELKPKRGRKKS